MKIIVVDDENSAIKLLVKTILEIDSNYDVTSFDSSIDALDYVKNNNVDVAFLDIEMPEMKGTELAKKLIELHPNINIIFSTGYEEYGIEAMKIHASGYILKPILKSDVEKELSHLRYFVSNKKRIYIRTKGNFDVLLDEKVVNFKRSASKEMLAYLVDRKGATVTRKEICSILFPDSRYDRNKQIYMSQIIASLFDALKENKIDNLIIKEYNSYKVNTSLYDTDINEIGNNDEYMSQFPWGKSNKEYHL